MTDGARRVVVHEETNEAHVSRSMGVAWNLFPPHSFHGTGLLTAEVLQ